MGWIARFLESLLEDDCKRLRKYMMFQCLVPVIAVLFAGFFFLRPQLMSVNRCTVPITAEVIDYDQEWRQGSDEYDEGEWHYVPTLKYSVDGIEYILRDGKTAFTSPDPAVGETVNILYNPDNPAEFNWKSGVSITWFGAGLYVIGFSAVTICSIRYIIAIKKADLSDSDEEIEIRDEDID